MTAEYLYEKQKSDGETDLPVEVKTYRIPLGINFFHPSGLGASVKGTYYNQDGDFVRLDGSVESGNDSFWLLDAAISYRLPKRYGFITVGGTNLTDEEFNYYDTDFENPLIQPDRTVYATVTLAFP
jgi:outer membrane receptor protein involved in Fe transport